MKVWISYFKWPDGVESQAIAVYSSLAVAETWKARLMQEDKAAQDILFKEMEVFNEYQN